MRPNPEFGPGGGGFTKHRDLLGFRLHRDRLSTDLARTMRPIKAAFHRRPVEKRGRGVGGDLTLTPCPVETTPSNGARKFALTAGIR